MTNHKKLTDVTASLERNCLYFMYNIFLPSVLSNIHIGELQIASLYAKLNGLKKIYFSGYFIRGNPVTMHTISYGINYWSKVIQLNLSRQTFLFNKYLLLTRSRAPYQAFQECWSHSLPTQKPSLNSHDTMTLYSTVFFSKGGGRGWIWDVLGKSCRLWYLIWRDDVHPFEFSFEWSRIFRSNHFNL